MAMIAAMNPIIPSSTTRSGIVPAVVLNSLKSPKSQRQKQPNFPDNTVPLRPFQPDAARKLTVSAYVTWPIVRGAQ